MTHFQAATTVGLRDRRFSLHPTVVLNAFLWDKWPSDDAAGGNSTWLDKKMRVIGAAGKSGRHLWPLVNMGGGGGGQVMLVAGREKVHFHGMPDRINPCLASDQTLQRRPHVLVSKRGATWRKRVCFLRKWGRNAPASTSPTPFRLHFNQIK